MSMNVEGVVLRGEEEGIAEFFCSLEPSIPLKLIRVCNDHVWGIYSDGTSGWHPQMVEIARLASSPFNIALYYSYFSVPSVYQCKLFSNGQLIHIQDDDPAKNDWPFKSNFEPLHLDNSINWDKVLEDLFRGGKGEVILEH